MNNSLSIYTESGNIFYQNFNTSENFYNFILTRQDDQTAPVPKKIQYDNSFEKYTQNFLPSFSIDDAEKFDFYANNMQNIYFADLMTTLKCLVEENKLLSTS